MLSQMHSTLRFSRMLLGLVWDRAAVQEISCSTCKSYGNWLPSQGLWPLQNFVSCTRCRIAALANGCQQNSRGTEIPLVVSYLAKYFRKAATVAQVLARANVSCGDIDVAATNFGMVRGAIVRAPARQSK